MGSGSGRLGKPLRPLHLREKQRELPGPDVRQFSQGRCGPLPGSGTPVGRGVGDAAAQLGEEDVRMPLDEGGQVRHQVPQLRKMLRNRRGVAGHQQTGALPVRDGSRQERCGQVVVASVDETAAQASPLPDRAYHVLGGECLGIAGVEGQ